MITVVPSVLQQGLAVTDSPTFAALTLATPLTVPNGGTGLATLAAGRIPYGAGVAAFASSADLTFDGTSFVVATAGPHAVGGATDADRQFYFRGAFTGASNTFGLAVGPTLTGLVGSVVYGLLVAPMLVEAGSGTHSLLVGIRVVPSITAGAAATTVAAGISVASFAAASGTVSAVGLKIDDAPTGATNNYALWVAGGLSKFDAMVAVSGAGGAVVSTMVGIELRGSATPSLTAYNRTASVYLPMVYDALSHKFSTGSVVVDSVGPHVIGGAANSVIQLILTGTFTASTPRAFSVNTTLVPSAGQNSFGVVVTPTINIAGSGVHALFAGLYVDAFAIGAGAGAVTAAASLYIAGGPSGAARNYPLWVASGNTRLDGALGFTAAGGIFFALNSGFFTWNTTASLDFTGDTERMRLTAAGIFAVGTTVLTGAGAGDVVLANNKALRILNAAGTSALAAIVIDGSNNILLGGTSLPVRGMNVAAASLPEAGAGQNGTIGVDLTNNRFVFYVGDLRFYITGTSF